VREHCWKYRCQPAATREMHETACEPCTKRGLTCEKEAGGGVCVSCCKLKIKCNHSAVKNVRPRRQRVVVKRAPSDIPVERRVKKSMPYIEVTSDDEPAQGPSQRLEPGPSRVPAPSQMLAPARDSDNGEQSSSKMIRRLTNIFRAHKEA
jgi:hypothetical protein